MKLALAILFAISLRAEVIQLGTVSLGTGIDIVWPDRPDIVSLEITFLKPGTGITNLVTIVTTNRLLKIADIPAELPDGRTILAMRWLTLGGIKSAYRLATMDLYRNPPDAPIARPTFVSNSQPLQNVQQFNGSQLLQNMQQVVVTNDAPVRAWHGAMTQSLSVDPNLARAVAEQFRKPTDPPPPLPPSTGGMQRAFQPETPARQAQRRFFEQGGQKGRTQPK